MYKYDAEKLVLNKIDMIEKAKLLPLIQELNQFKIFTDTFMISAKTGEKIEDLKNFLVENGIDESRITIIPKGSEEQLFNENNINRVVIVDIE